MERKRILPILAMALLGVLIGPGTIRSAAGDLKATDPTPADGATGVTIPLLRWTAGDTAVSHAVYFGTQADLTEADLVSPRQMFTMYYLASGLEAETTYYWRVDETEADDVTVHTGDVWSFTTLSETASNPNPPDGATSVDPDTDLTWTPGDIAAVYVLYFGTDAAAVADGANSTLVGIVADSTYDPGTLQSGMTYYWRISEQPRRGSQRPGPVWSFTVAEEGAGLVYYVDGVTGSDENDGVLPGTAFATIQKAIDVAVDGDLILVHPGVYHDPIDFLGKAVTVQSADDPAVLDVGDDFAVSFFTGEGPESTLANFIIQNSFLGVFLAQSSPNLRNLTIVDCKYGIEAYAQADPNITSCILWYNTAGDLFGCEARYSCIERNSPGLGNISSNPRFVGPDAGDYHLRSARGRYWPEHDVWVLDKVTSPCVNAGDPRAGYSREPQPNGARINMGAYGGTPYASLREEPGILSQAPTVVITTPTDGTIYGGTEHPHPGTITIEAEAWDADGYIAKVEFFFDGEKIGEDTDGNDGWAQDWTVSHSGDLMARATDETGISADSAIVRISVMMRR